MTEPRAEITQADAEARAVAEHAGLFPHAANWRSDARWTRPFSLGWMVFLQPADAPPGEGAFGLGPYFVTHAGEVFATGSGYPPEAYEKDVAVMAGATWNPILHVRYWARRLLDGRTPTRLR